jgi:hypothetical protein
MIVEMKTTRRLGLKSTIKNQQFTRKRRPDRTRFVGYDPIEGKVPRSAVAALPLIYRQVLPPA